MKVIELAEIAKLSCLIRETIRFISDWKLLMDVLLKKRLLYGIVD